MRGRMSHMPTLEIGWFIYKLNYKTLYSFPYNIYCLSIILLYTYTTNSTYSCMYKLYHYVLYTNYANDASIRINRQILTKLFMIIELRIFLIFTVTNCLRL